MMYNTFIQFMARGWRTQGRTEDVGSFPTRPCVQPSGEFEATIQMRNSRIWQLETPKRDSRRSGRTDVDQAASRCEAMM
jgi:hypothetical protein